MTHAFHKRFRIALSSLMLGAGLALACPNLARATVLGPDGGTGGVPFRWECPKGSYFVGFQGKAITLIDRMQPLCAPWMHSANIFGPFSVGPTFGDSRKGQTFFSTCNDSSVKNRAIASWTVYFFSSGSKHVSVVIGDCRSVASPRGPNRGWTLGQFSPKDLINTKDVSHECPFGELVTGIHGRKAEFIDAIGFICRPFPPKPLLPFETNVNPNAKAPTLPPSSIAPPPPPPSSSAPAQMNRSSSMFTTRGVDEKEAGSETPEPAKKP